MAGMRPHLPLAVFVLVSAATLLAPAAPATHDAIVPVMELAAQNIVPGIRPGAWMEEPGACTFAFVVEDEHGTLYITSAGHCVDRVGQSVTMRDEGPIGTVVAFRDGGATHDYALIRILPDKLDRVSPTMIGWGGPTGLYTGDGEGPTTAKHYGWGAATWADHTTRCRTALALPQFWNEPTFTIYGVTAWGDSGSGIMTGDGLALGINTHFHFGLGTSTGPRFDHVLAQLSTMTGLDLTLVPGGPVHDTCQPDG